MKIIKKFGYALTTGAVAVGLSFLALTNFPLSWILFSVYCAGFSALLYADPEVGDK